MLLDRSWKQVLPTAPLAPLASIWGNSGPAGSVGKKSEKAGRPQVSPAQVSEQVSCSSLESPP